jgi:hypothetical protein
MENFTMVETGRGTVKQTAIAVRPFFDASASNMGLEEYGMSLFDGVVHHEQLACLENNGVVRYLTGLNEFAPDVRLLNGPDKEAKVKEIRLAIIELEKELAANVIDLDDPQFWNKVKLLKPDNSEFWNRISLACGNEPLFLDPRDPYDRIKLFGIDYQYIAFFAMLIFAVHPIHTEVVNSLKNRDELLGLFFALLSLQKKVINSYD